MRHTEALNSHRAALAGLLTKMQLAEIAESDPAVRGKFEELAQAIRAADRLASDAALANAKYLTHCTRCEGIAADVLALVGKGA